MVFGGVTAELGLEVVDVGISHILRESRLHNFMSQTFKEWLRLDEMPHFSVQDPLTIPCKYLIRVGMELPCKPGVKIGMIDMRFEFYPKGGVFNKMGPFSIFAAPIPGSHDYLVYNSAAKVLPMGAAMRQGMLPTDARGRFVHQPGEKSENGYILLPDDWIKYAILLDQDYELIKQ